MRVYDVFVCVCVRFYVPLESLDTQQVISETDFPDDRLHR